MTQTVQAELPAELIADATAYIEAGWATNFSDLLADALRRYLTSHSSDLAESFLREDVEWGLHGRE